MVTGDNKLGRNCVKTMGMKEEFYDILSLILTFRPPSDDNSKNNNTKLGDRMSKEERQKLREKFKGTTMGDVNVFMESLPRDFLFVLRSTNIVRSLNKDLGGTSKGRFIAMAQSAIKGVELEEHNLQMKLGNTGLINSTFENLSLYLKNFWWWLFRSYVGA